MEKQLFIGLMSGTSADAIDAALVDFSQNAAQIIGTHSHPLPNFIKNIVHKLALSGEHELSSVRDLDQRIAQHCCTAIEQLCSKSHIDRNTIIAIGSHGQTVRHYPPIGTRKGYTLQVGDPNIIAQHTGITTVSDFRRRDIAAGGHGAPLTPAFHNQAFRAQDTNRIIINLGGIANITVLDKNPVIGYDTGPANGLMDSWCQKHKQQPYDNNGEWAAGGQVNDQLLEQLLHHPFFLHNFPKSTGRESFNLPWIENELQQLGQIPSPQDIQTTLLHLTAESVSRAIEAHDPQRSYEVYLCGGGTHNLALCQLLTMRLFPRHVATTEALGISPDWVEAAAFAWLAKQAINYATGNLTSVTGADMNVVLGGIYPGNNIQKYT